MCFIHHVVVHQRGDVNEFHDHGEIDMPGFDLSGCAAGEESKQRPKAFALAAKGVDDVAFDSRIKCRGLLGDARLDLFEMRLN